MIAEKDNENKSFEILSVYALHMEDILLGQQLRF